MRHERQFAREMRAHRQGAFLKGFCRLLGDFLDVAQTKNATFPLKKVCFSSTMPKGLNVVFLATWWFWENKLSQRKEPVA